jgi:hypothetical protein
MLDPCGTGNDPVPPGLGPSIGVVSIGATMAEPLLRALPWLGPSRWGNTGSGRRLTEAAHARARCDNRRYQSHGDCFSDRNLPAFPGGGALR